MVFFLLACQSKVSFSNPIQCLERSRLDPNDPRNAELLHLVESIPSITEKDHYFRLVAVDEAERFVSDREFDKNRRFAVLKMREEGVSSTTGYV